MHPTFTQHQLAEAQQRLGLSSAELAFMLGYTPQQLRRMKTRNQDKGAFRPVQPVTARLLQAYLDGYRPADWQHVPRET